MRMEDHMNKDDHDAFFDSSDQIKNLHSKCNRMRIVQICGGPFSGKYRQGRELARKVALSAKSYKKSYCFRVDLPFEMECAEEMNENIKKTMNRSVLEQLEGSGQFTDKPVKWFHQFLRSQRDKYFVCVFDDVDLFGIDLFLKTLKDWTEQCQNLFVIFTSQFQYTLYHTALTHCCKPLDTFSVQFFRQQIDIFKYNCTDAPEVTATDEELKKLAELVECWPFLIMVLADGLVDGFTAKELTELLIKKPLLTLSNEAASQTDQLDSKLEYMVDKLSPRMKKYVDRFADLPERKKVTIQEMMTVTKLDIPTADFKLEVVHPLRRNLLLNQHQDSCTMLPFLVNSLNVNQLTKFKTPFVIQIDKLVYESLESYAEEDDNDFKRCWKQDEPQLKELWDQMKLFDSTEHSETQVDKDCEKLIHTAEKFVKSATLNSKNEVKRFRERAFNAKTIYYGDGRSNPEPSPLMTMADFESLENNNHEQPTGHNGTNEEPSVFDLSMNNNHEQPSGRHNASNEEPSVFDLSMNNNHEQPSGRHNVSNKEPSVFDLSMNNNHEQPSGRHNASNEEPSVFDLSMNNNHEQPSGRHNVSNKEPSVFDLSMNNNHEQPSGRHNVSNEEPSVFDLSMNNNHEQPSGRHNASNEEPSVFDFSHISLHEQATAEYAGRIVPGGKSFEYL
ncbi:uncharacterized protein [Antedon mediterranea]|uniref:uncharacterized protein n=1 Tax=Antedon mediterranea TaxID=105859 RepID=UPI003AF6F0F0